MSTAAADASATAEFVAALTFGAGPTAAIVAGTGMLLGASAGLVGTFAVLRRRALVTDALGHATLPGVVFAFLVASALGLDGRHPVALMLGATASAALALYLLNLLRTRGRIDGDAATSAVLAGAFGLGLALMGLVHGLELPRANGLDHVLLGQMATARVSDLYWLAGVAAVCLVLVFGARHALAAVAFDEEHAALLGLHVGRYDALLLGLLFAVTVSALPIVGAVLVVALVVLPPAAARCWSDRLPVVLVLAAVFGAASAWIGAALSFAIATAPAGAVVVLVAGTIFTVSLLFAPRRGLVARYAAQRRTRTERLSAALASELRTRAAAVPLGAFSRRERAAFAHMARVGEIEFADGRVRSTQERA